MVFSKEKILLADDDPVTLQLCRRILTIAGMDVDTAANGFAALEKLRTRDYIVFVTDWMMPEMDGPELVRQFLSMPPRYYTHIIMLTSRVETGDLVHGFECGVDDYLTKPFEKEELLARVNSGIRIAHLNRKLQGANRMLDEANRAMRKDLDAARKAQESLLPSSFPEVPGLEFAARMIPSAFVAGDTYNIFRLDETRIGFYIVDVSGHGVQSALFSVSLNQILTQDISRQGLLLVPAGEAFSFRINSPAQVMALLNQTNMLEKHGHYFTMLYAILDVVSGRIVFARAGHNPPLLLHPGGSSEYIMDGAGHPIGLGIPCDEFPEHTVELQPGDVFIMYSDGITDASMRDADMERYGMERMRQAVAAGVGKPMPEIINAVLDDVNSYTFGPDRTDQENTFEDDVSILGIRWNP
ncbi:MAG TPA: SpoIIE family protein phosphatase [Candidatus Sumerlaeota bacterium]|nr:SpoIIE family protein phosphatase [Candidatus Sumerlaeota bacterium]